MIRQSVSEARRKLGELIDVARAGEQVVIIRNKKPVAALCPIDASDVESIPAISDRQARRLWEMAVAEPGKSFRSGRDAVTYPKKHASGKR
jgi:prevent-host-death family protein